MDSLWLFLFKYSPVVFERGRLVWAAPVPRGALLLGVALLLAAVAWSYLRARGRVGRRDRLALLGLRTAAVLLLAFALFRPTLLVPVAVPQQNYLAVLIDDSRSMRIADREGEPRSAFVQRVFGSEQSALLEELGRRFRLRFIRFSDDAERMEVGSELSFSGPRTYLARALDRAREDLDMAPLAGMVLVTDGADMPQPGEATPTETELSAALLALRAASIPVYTVGVGREAYERDVEVSRVSAPRSTLVGSTLFVDVVLRQVGYAGETVRLFVEDEGRIVHAQDVKLPSDGASAVVQARLVAGEPGPRRFGFRVQPQAGERVLENNQRDALIEVRDRTEKILYFEGEPRFEVKFMRRAVADDPNLQLVVLQRTAEDKFLRLDVDSAAELETGFPRTREELFSYDALILGSVEASFFSNEQLRMIEDFVAERGGGLLVLGGRHSFAEGGYVGTPLADVLPVALDARDRDTTFFAALHVRPTRAGLAHGVTQVVEDPAELTARWASLPALSTFNRVRGLKPGAVALLTATSPQIPGGQVVLAHQRYGRGKATAFVAQDSWTWQMHAEIPLDDPTHERFWRQLLRWLVSDVPGAVEVATADRVPPGQPVRLTALVRDRAFRNVNDAEVVAQIESPDGALLEVPLRWVVEREGEYAGSYTPRAQGTHRVTVSARRGGQLLSTESAFLRAEPDDGEFFEAQMRAPLLRRIAEETGGRFYTQSNLSVLPEEISYGGRGVTVVEEREIWDMPIVFLLLVALLGAEWGYRRARGLP